MRVPRNAEKRVIAVLSALLIAGAAFLLLTTRGPAAHLVAPDASVLTGSFSFNGVYPTTVFQNPDDVGEAAFGSWQAAGPPSGHFASAVFRAPKLLNFCISGYPTQDGISLYLEDADDRRQLALKVSADPHETWKRMEWVLPSDWRGRSVRLVADNQPRPPLAWWIGITLPREGGAHAALPMLAQAAAYSGVMAAEAALFLLPGLVLAMLLLLRVPLDGLRFTAVVFTGAAAVGYVCFWIYFANVSAGKAASWFLLGASALGAPQLIGRAWKRSAKLLRECAIASALVLLTAWFYLGIGYFYNASDSIALQAADRFTMKQLPPDHLLPWLLAQRIYDGQPLRPYLLDIWKSSDRPPLQAGIALAQCPFWKTFDQDTHYYLLAIFLQSLWAGALWIFLRFAAVSRKAILLLLAFCVFSDFFFLNSFYAWPKLLAAALFLIGLTFTPFSRPDQPWNRFDAALCGAAVGLALLSHSGVLLALPGVLWALYRSRALPNRRMAVWFAASVVLFWLPWVLYQKLYDPPGDLLLKAHLAGSIDQQHSFGQLILEGYARLGLAEIARNKLENLRVLFVPYNFRPILAHDSLARYDAFTRGSFYSMFQALGVLTLGFLARLGIRWLRPQAATHPEIRLADRCVAAALLSTGFWCLIMFNPGSTIIHQGSLAIMLMLFLALGIYLAELAPRLALAASAAQMLIFPVFVVGKFLFGNPPGTLMEGAIDPGFAALALLSVAALLIWAGFAKADHPGPASLDKNPVTARIL